MGLSVATPVMTSNTAPSGVASLDPLSTEKPSGAFYLFKSTDASRVAYTTSAVVLGTFGATKNSPHWGQYGFPSGVQKFVTEYEFYINSSSNQLTAFSLQGSNNGTDWDVLHSVTGFDNATVQEWVGPYTVTTPGNYRYYRLSYDDWDVLGGFPDYVGLGGVILREWDGEIALPKATLDFTPLTVSPITGDYAQLPKATLDFIPLALSIAIDPGPVILLKAVLDFTPLALALAITPRADIPATTIYRFTLTGAPDAQTDIVLPMSSFQARLRPNKATYLSVVVPDGGKYAGDVADRPNGELVVEQGIKYIDGNIQYVEIVRATLDDPQDNGGGRNRTLTLIGHETKPKGTQKEIVLQNATFRSSTASGKTYRADLDLNLRAGDIATVGTESIVVGLLTYIVNVDNGEFMTVAEEV